MSLILRRGLFPIRFGASVCASLRPHSCRREGTTNFLVPLPRKPRAKEGFGVFGRNAIVATYIPYTRGISGPKKRQKRENAQI